MALFIEATYSFRELRLALRPCEERGGLFGGFGNDDCLCFLRFLRLLQLLRILFCKGFSTNDDRMQQVNLLAVTCF
jgi:hypothetical protein